MRGGDLFWSGIGWDVCVRERNDRLVDRLNEREGGGFSWYGMVWYGIHTTYIPRLSRPRGTSIHHTHTHTNSYQTHNKTTTKATRYHTATNTATPPTASPAPLPTHTRNPLTRIPLPTGQRKANLVTGKNPQKGEEEIHACMHAG